MQKILFSMTDEEDDYQESVRITCMDCGHSVVLMPYQVYNKTTLLINGCMFCLSKRIYIEEE